jgi:hypothetical protein
MCKDNHELSCHFSRRITQSYQQRSEYLLLTVGYQPKQQSGGKNNGENWKVNGKIARSQQNLCLPSRKHVFLVNSTMLFHLGTCVVDEIISMYFKNRPEKIAFGARNFSEKCDLGGTFEGFSPIRLFFRKFLEKFTLEQSHSRVISARCPRKG